MENPREKEAENKKIKLKKYNNIYKFEAKTLGKYKYKDFKGGDIYIIQTEFNLKGFYKIGITTNLYKKLENYYISSPNHLIEPKLYYYYPCKNINEVDKLIKQKLEKYNIKNEIYKIENLEEVRNIIKEIQEIYTSEKLEIIAETKECEIIKCKYCEIYLTNSLDMKIHVLDKHEQEQNKKIKTANLETINTINSLGYEDILNKLSEKEKIYLVTGVRCKEEPIIELVRHIYTNDNFKDERNTVITNLRSASCFIYQSETNKFIVTNKNDHIDDIIERRRTNIISIYKELLKNNKLKVIEIKIIDDYLEKIENITNKEELENITVKAKKLKELYEKHKNEITYIIYNCREFMEKLRNNLGNPNIDL